jgi:peptidoglycan-N-acetylglucosamine deacetylase
VSELRVALTFDAEHPSRAGQSTDAPHRILDVLHRTGVRGTFFLQGRWATAFPATARRIAEDGHLVGNHSNYHAPMTLLSAEGIRADVGRAEERIAEVTGADPRPWFRCPFGDGADAPNVRETLEAIGYRNVSWSVDPDDWKETATPKGIAEAVVLGAESLPQSNVVFHTWSSATAAALEDVIERLRAEHASFVTVSELADDA